MNDQAQIPLSLVISIGGGLLSMLVVVLGIVARYAYTHDREAFIEQIKTLTTRLERHESMAEEARKDRDVIRERLHADELQTSQIQGEVNLVKNNHDKLADDVEEIKRTMVTRDLFDASVQHLKSQLTQILTQLQRYPSTREMQRVSIPRTDPTSEPPRR